MKSSRFASFALGVALTFGAFIIQNAVAQDSKPSLPNQMSFGLDQGGIYDDGQYIYVVQPKSHETLMISKTIKRSMGGESIPEAYRFLGTNCELVRSKTWK